MTQQWLWWALLSACFAACTAIFAKIGLKNVDADLAMFWRTLFIVLLLLPWLWGLNKLHSLFKLSNNAWWWLFLSALATGVSWLCYFRALQMGPVSRVAPIDKLSLVFVALLAYSLLGERPSLYTWLGLGLVTVGMMLIAFIS